MATPAMHAHCSARVPSSDLRGPGRERPPVCMHVVCVTSAAWQENQLVSAVVAVLTDGDTNLAKRWTETSYIFSLCLPVGLWGVEVTLGSKGAPGKYSQCLQPFWFQEVWVTFAGDLSYQSSWEKSLLKLTVLFFLSSHCCVFSLAVFPLDIWLPSISAQVPVFALPW